MLKRERETMEIDKIIKKDNMKYQDEFNNRKKGKMYEENLLKEYEELYQCALLESRAKAEQIRELYNIEKSDFKSKRSR